MAINRHSVEGLRSRFDQVYESSIIGAGFVESDEYYKLTKERYWRSLQFLCELDIKVPVKVLEIGGGQLAVLLKKLFDDNAAVADISGDFSTPLIKEGIEFFTLNLMDPKPSDLTEKFDLIILLEVIEHIPLPPHVVIERIKTLLNSGGILFITTPNLFRIRNLIRMFMGIEFLDRFTLPEPGQGLGHQHEYSADHLSWQIQRAGLDVVLLKHDQFGRKGHSLKSKLGRTILAPLLLRPKWRDGIAIAARKPLKEPGLKAI